ncbi:MAG: D-2-hydroxyacid dehydrogenase [Halobacteriaceae archaeon]
MASEPTILVRRGTNHGIETSEYAAKLRDRTDAAVVHASTPDEEFAAIEDAEIVTGGDLRGDLLDAAANLRLFAGTSAGYDHLPLDEFRTRGVAVTNASGVHGPNIAEQVMGWILTFGRNLHEGWRREHRPEWRHFQSHELAGETVAIVGLGGIGQALVPRLEGFDVTTVGVRYTPAKGGPTDEVYGFDEIHEAVADAAYVVVACPLSDATENLVDGPVFKTMRADSVLVNVGRGPIVDTEALMDAVRNSRIRGAALDVTDPEPLPHDHPLWDFENVLVTPHNAGHSPKLFDRLADLLAGNVERVRESGYADLENQVV